MADNKGATKAELVKFIKEEIAQTEEALGFVNETIASGRHTQFNRTYVRKQAEYEGVLWSLNAVLDLAEGREADNGSNRTEPLSGSDDGADRGSV